jgi:hypothetical protein
MPRPHPSRPVHAADPVPATAVAAGVLGLLGVAPLGLLVWVVSALSEQVGPGLVLVLAVTAAQLAGAILLLCRRSWLPLVLACLPGSVLLLVVLAAAPYGSSARLGYLLVACPLAAALAALPGVRRWVAAR